MADTIKVPFISKPLPKPAVFIGLGAVVLAIAVYFRNRQNQPSAAGADAGAADELGLDSGGLAADDSGLLDEGTYPWDGTYGNPSDPYSMDTGTGQTFGNEGLGGSLGGGGSGDTGLAPGPPFSSNTQWSAYAIQQLTQQSGLNAGNVTRALGLYLSGKALTTAEQDIVYAAIGVAGAVPVNGPGGYPPKVRAASTQGNGGKGGTTFASNPVKGLKAKVTGSTLELTWSKSDHATGYQVSLTNTTGHRSAGSVTTAKTSYTFRNLTRGAVYEATVLAKPAEKGAHGAKVQARTEAGRT